MNFKKFEQILSRYFAVLDPDAALHSKPRPRIPKSVNGFSIVVTQPGAVLYEIVGPRKAKQNRKKRTRYA